MASAPSVPRRYLSGGEDMATYFTIDENMGDNESPVIEVHGSLDAADAYMAAQALANVYCAIWAVDSSLIPERVRDNRLEAEEFQGGKRY